MKISTVTIEQIKQGKLVKNIPELYELKNFVENNAWHDHDNDFTHTITVLARLRKNTRLSFIKKSGLKKEVKKYLNSKVENSSRLELLNFIALFHDIAKPLTFTEKDGITMCPNHEEIGSELADGILHRLDLREKEINFVTKTIKIHGYPHKALDRTKTEKQLDKEFAKLKNKCKNNFVEIILLALSDTEGAQLNYKNPEEYNFRIRYYHRLMNSRARIF